MKRNGKNDKKENTGSHEEKDVKKSFMDGLGQEIKSDTKSSIMEIVIAASIITLVSGLCLFGVLDSWCQVLQGEDTISLHAAEDTAVGAGNGTGNEADETPTDSIQNTIDSDMDHLEDACEGIIDAATVDNVSRGAAAGAVDSGELSGNACGNGGWSDSGPTSGEKGGALSSGIAGSGASTGNKPNGNKPATTTGSSNNPTHTHSYKPIYKTVHHDAVTHTEQVQVGSDPIYQTVSHVVCRGCGQQDPSAEHLNRHMENGENATTYTTYEDVITGYTPVYENRTIVEKAAYDEQVKEYEICSCGARR